MALSNKQYDKIMRDYDRKQYQNYRQQRQRMDEIYEKIPRIQEIEEAISSCSLAHAEKIFFSENKNKADEQKTVMQDLKAQLQSFRKEKELLLEQAGYPKDYLDMHYTCPDCEDTGYINRKKCHCFHREEIKLLYSDSHLDAILSKENFSNFSFDVYDEEQKQAMPPIISACRNFLQTFSENCENLLLYGSVGTGKTFLSNCIAKELLDRKYSVVYFTSFQLFELFQFNGNQNKEDFQQYYESILESDLLILDDLGTELVNAFTVSKLFQVLNERALRKKSTIISTNLALKEFRDIYSERIFSRIINSYTLLKFVGSDIRVRQKILQSN